MFIEEKKKELAWKLKTPNIDVLQKLPRELAKDCLYPKQKLVMLTDEELEFSYNYEIVNAAGNCNDMFLASGWFEYVMAKNLKIGEELEFTYDKEENNIYVKKVM